MGRNNSSAWGTIHSICEADHIDERRLYEKTKLVLSKYRNICWQTRENADDTIADLCTRASSDIDGALVYLETFAPEREKDVFETKIMNLFNIRNMIDIVDSAIAKTRDFPCGGDVYSEIISKCYLTKWKYTERDLLEILDMDRSRFYDKKKEAIMIFGISLFGTAIPRYRKIVSDRYD
ncbi:MAG: hypothetical protein J6N70_11675 [Oribacterium sp.]|nr:hypothetical protein [Oribacterium sp.]